jgi:hypothetical protein
MDAVQLDWITKKALDILAGIEIGVIGGIVMLLWLAISAPLIGYPWWSIINLFASHSYSARVVRDGVGMATVSGIALQIAVAGIIGGITGFLTPGGRLFGLAITFAWYALCYGFLWKRYAPLVPVYAPQPLLVIGFFLYGSVLGWHPAIASRLYASNQTPVRIP